MLKVILVLALPLDKDSSFHLELHSVYWCVPTLDDSVYKTVF